MDGVEVSDSRRTGCEPVSGIDWSVEAGECWIVGGIQGSGVTAFLETAAGLRPAAAGSIRLFGQHLASLHGDTVTEVRRRIGFVFSGSGRLFFPLTAIENITLPLQYHTGLSSAEAIRDVTPLLEWLGLASVAGTHPARFGRSMRLRVALARALALRPELIVLDDPLAGLDTGQIRWWRQIVESLIAGCPWLGGKPATVLLGTETLRPWLALGHRFAMIDQGSLRLLGDRDAVLACADPSVREILGEPA